MWHGNVYVPKGYLYFNGQIDGKAVVQFNKELLYLDSRKGSAVNTVIMNSGGGSIAHAFSMYDMIRCTSKQTNILVTGYCCSAAVLVLQAADVRLSHPNTSFMVHEGSMGVDFQRFSDVKGEVTGVMLMWERYKKIISNRAKMKDFAKLADKEATYFDAAHAKKLRLIDQILGGE
jgi:ATP-dependent protease ClpP protease subunit